MCKLKLFIDNFLVYGLGSIISKIIPLIMVPIVTRLIPNTEYFGINDLTNTAISFSGAIAIVGMYDAMYRMFFEQEDTEYKKTVCSTALHFTMATSIIVFIILLATKDLIADFLFGKKDYAYLVYIIAIATLVSATNCIISAPTRMQNKRKVFLVTNTVSPILAYTISIPLLLQGHYVIALPIASVVSGISLEIAFGIMNRNWFSPKMFDRKLLKQMLVIALPLFPSFLVYWVFNSCDRIMISKMMSVAEVGIYSVGAKLGHLSQLIYSAFAGGWLYFSFSTMKEDNQVQTNSLVFEYLGTIAYAATMFMCAWSYPIFKTLFVGDYISGYTIAPYLFMAPLMQMLFQILANQFVIIKKTWPNIVILSAGALGNVLINFLLIPRIGIEGASLATLLGYGISVLITVAVSWRMGLMKLSPRFAVITCCVVLYMASWRFLYRENFIIGTLIAMAIIALYVYLYRGDLKKLLMGLKNQKTKDKGKEKQD